MCARAASSSSDFTSGSALFIQPCRHASQRLARARVQLIPSVVFRWSSGVWSCTRRYCRESRVHADARAWIACVTECVHTHVTRRTCRTVYSCQQARGDGEETPARARARPAYSCVLDSVQCTVPPRTTRRTIMWVCDHSHQRSSSTRTESSNRQSHLKDQYQQLYAYIFCF